jgi:N-acylneuraminate cytidylyltransferase
MKTLVVIPARGGSKGIPKKNIKNFCGKPLIYYSIDIARNFVNDEDICVSTDDDEIKSIVENYGLKVPFTRPEQLSGDQALTNDVLVHAIEYYKIYEKKQYDKILLLQPTSPLRTVQNVQDAINLYNRAVDMVVSVKKSHSVSVLCKENSDGKIELVFNKNLLGRQNYNDYYEYNGAIYIMKTESLLDKGMSKFENIIKTVMTDEESIDIDNPTDWIMAEAVYSNKYKIN